MSIRPYLFHLPGIEPKFTTHLGLLYEVVRFGLRRIDRVAAAPGVEIEAVVRAEIDRQLRQLGLIDPHGQLTPAALTQFEWQRTCLLPMPHVLVKT